MTFLTIIIFILILGLLVFVHEAGHFIAAKLSKIKVEEFAFGFPPKIWSIKKGETVYAINAIPIGGYVKMLGEAEESQSKRSFSKKSPGIRAAVSVAGVLMNVILAWLILTIGFAVGMSPLVSSPDSIPGKKLSSSIIVAGIDKNSVAENIGLQPGDNLISAISPGEQVTIFNGAVSVTNYTTSHEGRKIELVYKRDNVEKLVDATLPVDGSSPLGISMVDNSIVRTAWYFAPVVAFREIARIIGINFTFLKSFFAQLFTHGQVSKEVGGPVAIYVFTGMAVKAGAMVVLQFIAILSISLALINILPFPALDGGRLLFIILEKIFRKKIVNDNIENIIHMVGFALILLFAAAITYRDVINLIIKK
ncbi:MAG: M50 family metallopeptidase [Candidatus Berkelbacteria bacterium]